MKVAIIYETKRKKATVQVVEWLSNALKSHDVDVTTGKPEDYDSLDFDAFIIGSSVYAGNVQAQLLDFIVTRKEEIVNKPVAAFVVCKEVKHPREQNLVQILDKLPTEAISEQCFEGYMLRKGDFENQESKAIDWVKEFLSKLSG
jgi:menaquinone-dependent protoporphyrinogen IX oxidase